jgi:hypothetical protein
MKWLAFLALLILIQPAFAQGVTQPPPAQGAIGPATALTPAPDERAKQWLSLVDDGNYAEAYKQAGNVMHNVATADSFAKNVGDTRAPLGAMASRNIKDIKMTKTLPGMRDGQYATVQFDSSFAHKAAAVETVVLISDKGAWSVIGYHIS